jgi:DNA modification methylase
MALNCKRYAPSHEGIWAFGIPHYWNDELNTEMSVWDIAPQLSEEHPCPYPEDIPMRVLQSSCPPDGIAFDPFAGAGTTLVAAKKLGRHFLGFELSEEYCAIARRRLGEIDAQPSLFQPKPEQMQLVSA